MIDLVSKRFWYFLISAVVIVPGLFSLLLPGGLKWGIEFTSGSAMTLSFDSSVEQAGLRAELAELGYDEAIIQRTGGGSFLVRTREITAEEKGRLEMDLEERLGPLQVLDFYSVSPVVASEIRPKAMIAVSLAAIGILLYISWAFRRIPKPFRYGSCAIVALAHDVLVVLGIFSILGRLFNIQIDAMFITAVLAVVGYSVNNTVVVFDRVRENLGKEISRQFEVVVGRSLVETVSRSLNTSLTTVFVLVALYLFGGVTIRNFILVLILGTIAGTYSSLLIAGQLLVVWEKGELGRLWRRVVPARE
ncbi:MAG: protein translocase subunit SecF [Dehalococcoidia bacterium]